MNETLQESIDRQRRILQDWLSAPLIRIAGDCRQVWPDRQTLEARLMDGLTELPYCKYLYLLDEQSHQITSNASRDGLLEEHYGRDRSNRPYLATALAGAAFSLSDAYISRNARRPSLTAVQIIQADNGRRLGYLGADFDLRELPATQALSTQPGQWMQLKATTRKMKTHNNNKPTHNRRFKHKQPPHNNNKQSPNQLQQIAEVGIRMAMNSSRWVRF